MKPDHLGPEGGAAPDGSSKGELFLDTEAPRVLPGFADAQCVGGALVVRREPELERDFMSALPLRAMPGNTHPIEYQLFFYVDLRLNKVDRVRAFLAQ